MTTAFEHEQSQWRRIRELLRQYEPKKLIAFEYKRGGICCAVGVVLPVTCSHAPMGRPARPITQLVREDDRVAEAMCAAGFDPPVLDRLQRINDRDRDYETPCDRYRRVLGDIDAIIDPP